VNADRGRPSFPAAALTSHVAREPTHFLEHQNAENRSVA